MAGAATVEKAMDLLFHLHEAGTPLGLSEIGRNLELPKSSCHRLLAALVRRDVVEQDAAGRYRPGLALLALGLGAQTREPVVQAARPTLEEEAVALGETVFLVGRRRGRLRVLDKAEGSGFLRAAPGVGDLVPSDVTAVGKLYRVLAPQLEPESRSRPPAEAADAALHAAAGAEDGADADAVSAGRGPARLPVASEDSQEEQAIRLRGYATNRDAWIDGLSVLAVPIWQGAAGGASELVAALALGAASARFDAIGEPRIAGRLLAAASRVGDRLGAGPAPPGEALGEGSPSPSGARRR